MSRREPDPDLFRRWLLVVYLPLAVFVLCLSLVVGRILTGVAVWFVVLLGLYCVIPVRLIFETQRKGLELPKPPGATRGASRAPARRTGGRPARPAARRPPARAGLDEEVPLDEQPAARRQLGPEVDLGSEGAEARVLRRGSEPDEDFDFGMPERAPRRPGQGRAPRARTVGATEARGTGEIRESIERPRRPPRKNPQMVRRRAMASIIGIGILLLVGGILVVVGIGRVTSSFGLVMVGVGGFLMILSVTLPTFRLVDAILRAIGRLLARRPAPPRQVKPNGRRRSA